jgi:phosphate transport system protein
MTNLHLGEHISQKFNQDLEAIRTLLLELGGMVERQVADSVRALVEANSDIAKQVIRTEDDVDLKEVQIDEECTKILARRQPAASDLRLVLAVSKINLDLERVGDEASKIAEAAIALCEEGNSPRGYIEIRHIGSGVHKMIHDALDAFARFDVDLALRIMNDDKEIDREYATALREMMTYMMEDPRSISRIMRIIWVLRSLERVGDHARNISEQVIYLVKGKDVRHISVNDARQKMYE